MASSSQVQLSDQDLVNVNEFMKRLVAMQLGPLYISSDPYAASTECTRPPIGELADTETLEAIRRLLVEVVRDATPVRIPADGEISDDDIDQIARKFADLIDSDNASKSANVPTYMARIGGAIREAISTVIAEAVKPFLEALTISPEDCGRIMHESWMRTMLAQGFHRRPPESAAALERNCPCDKCHADLVPWDELPERQKDINRNAFVDVLAEIRRRAGRTFLDRGGKPVDNAVRYVPEPQSLQWPRH